MRIKWLRVVGWPEHVELAIKVSLARTFWKDPSHYVEKFARNGEGYWRAVADAVKAVQNRVVNWWGYEPALEMVGVYFVAKCSRICAMELDRHRHASYAETSSRVLFSPFNVPYIKRALEAGGLLLAELCDPRGHEECVAYLRGMMEKLQSKQIGLKEIDSYARYAQPHSLRMDIFVATNLREVLNILEARLQPKAHEEIKDLANSLAFRLWLDYGIPTHLMLFFRNPWVVSANGLLSNALHQASMIIKATGDSVLRVLVFKTCAALGLRCWLEGEGYGPGAEKES